MARERKDRTANWYMEHHGGSLLRLANITNFVSWKAAHSVLTFPKQVPDGLLDVTFPDKATPDPFLIEIETYPQTDTVEQIRRDLAMVLLTRGVVPDILLLVLLQKGNLAINAEQIAYSARGLTEFRLKVRVINMWTLSATELLAAGDVNLVPWAPLAAYDGKPEALLQRCRERIEQEANPQEIGNLLAATRVMAEARYNDPQLLNMLGEHIMSLSLQRAFETIRFERLLADKAREAERETQEAALEGAREGARVNSRKYIVRMLLKRFGAVPKNVETKLRAIQDQEKLDSLHDLAADCPDLKTFQKALVK